MQHAVHGGRRPVLPSPFFTSLISTLLPKACATRINVAIVKFRAHFPLPKSLARSSPPARPIVSGSASPKRVAWRICTPNCRLSSSRSTFPQFGVFHLLLIKPVPPRGHFRFSSSRLLLQLNPGHGRSYVFLGQLGAAFDDSMQQHQTLFASHKCRIRSLSFPCCVRNSRSFPVLAMNRETAGSVTFLFQHFDERQCLGLVLHRQAGKDSSTGAPPRMSTKKSTRQLISYRVSFI